MSNSMLALAISLGVVALCSFYLSYKYKEKIGLGFGFFFMVFAGLSVYYGALGHPAKCDVGYYKMLTGVYENKEFYFLVRGVSDGTDKSIRLCTVPFKNIHTLQWQDVHIWLVDGENGQELYLSPPSVEVDTD